MDILDILKQLISNYQDFEKYELLKMVKWLNQTDKTDTSSIESVIKGGEFRDDLLYIYNKNSTHTVTVSILDTSFESNIEHKFKYDFDNKDVAIQAKVQLESRVKACQVMDENFEINGYEFPTKSRTFSICLESNPPTVYMWLGDKIMFE